MTSDTQPPPSPPRHRTRRELDIVERMVFGRNRLLWVGVMAVMTPLVILLVLQYRWLSDLEQNMVVSRRASLDNYLQAISNDVHFSYITLAELALNLPPPAYTEATIQSAVHAFGSRDLAGARRLFIVTFQPIPTLYFYEPGQRAMVEPEQTPEVEAVWVAMAPWNTLYKLLAEVQTTEFTVDEHDPDNRIVLNPVTDESATLVAVVGMIIDQSTFLDRILPDAVAQSLPTFETADALWVCVRDNENRRVFPPKPCATVEEARVSRTFDFVFTDWTMSLQGELAVPENWARANFVINVTLSGALAVVLLGGIAFTVRTAMREMKLSAMKNEFVSNVSHELRTPLASIRVFGELLRRGRASGPDKVTEYGSYIETESRRLTQLINNILDFSRIESGEKIYSFEPTDLEELLTGTLASFTVRLRDHGLELSYDGPDEPLPDVWVDTNAIDRAIANLLDNAVKYSQAATSITVRLERRGDEIVLSVIDRGVGIPADEHERIFDRFHRVGTGLVHDVKGTGLGLSLVQHIVRAHGGSVSVASEVGKGSTFSIHLPIGWRPNGNRRAPWHES